MSIAEPLKCQRAILKESGKFVQAKTKALAKCEEAKLKGKLDVGTTCLTEPKTAVKIAAAESKLRSAIQTQCGGRDKTCGAGGDDDIPSSIGWPAQCPDFEGMGCSMVIDDCSDIADCVACIDEAAVHQAIDLTYGDFTSGSSSDVKKCQVAFGKAVTKFIDASSKALAKCYDTRLNGKHQNPCPSPGDGKAEDAIAKAEAAKRSTICKACGGDDKTCGGTDDVGPDVFGFTDQCPNANGCGGPVATLEDAVDCVDCVAQFKVDCVVPLTVPAVASYPPGCAVIPPTATPTVNATPTRTPTATQTPGGGPICGNGMVESGEGCDDGNNEGCDACPADCQTTVSPCSTNTVRHAQQVRLQAPASTQIGGVLVCLSYPDGVVSLPGTGSVSGRVQGFNGLSAVNDSDTSARISLVPNTPAQQLTFTVSFDLCIGASSPPPAAFSCVTRDASDEFGMEFNPPSQVVCTAQ